MKNRGRKENMQERRENWIGNVTTGMEAARHKTRQREKVDTSSVERGISIKCSDGERYERGEKGISSVKGVKEVR